MSFDAVNVGGSSSPALQLRGISKVKGYDLSTLDDDAPRLRLEALGRLRILLTNASRNAERGVVASKPGETGMTLEQEKKTCLHFSRSRVIAGVVSSTVTGAAGYKKAPSILSNGLSFKITA